MIRLGVLEQKVNECDQNSVWRLKDCQELLKNRVNDQYVKDAVRLLDEKCSREVLIIYTNILNDLSPVCCIKWG